jgi:hypothetical protein
MCQSRSVPVSMAACGCGCCGCGPSSRGFHSAEEELKRLRRQRDQLEKELAGIRGRMDQLAET